MQRIWAAATLTIPAEALQAVSQQLTVSVDPPCFIRHLIQLLIFVLSCKNKVHSLDKNSLCSSTRESYSLVLQPSQLCRVSLFKCV